MHRIYFLHALHIKWAHWQQAQSLAHSQHHTHTLALRCTMVFFRVESQQWICHFKHFIPMFTGNVFVFRPPKKSIFILNASNTKLPMSKSENKNLCFAVPHRAQRWKQKQRQKHTTKSKNNTNNRMESTDHIGLLTVNERNIRCFTNSQCAHS